MLHVKENIFLLKNFINYCDIPLDVAQLIKQRVLIKVNKATDPDFIKTKNSEKL